MPFPRSRPRRLRRTAEIRDFVREIRVEPRDLVLPLFCVPGTGVREPVPSMPGVERLSADQVALEAKGVRDLGIPAVILFGIPDRKDPLGSGAYDPDGVVQTALRAVKDAVPELVAIADVCLCEYTDHGHCGVYDGSDVQNDATLPLLARTAVSLARAGADVVAPSDMMDGRIGAVRDALDTEGLEEIPILAYAAKYASAFYGPFRDAAQSTPQQGDRRSYQMDPANVREALREIETDLEEGADLVMVKPALPYLDVLRAARERFEVPLFAYQVSGEYSMLQAAIERGWLDGARAIDETLTAIRRAGADRILTYFARDFARRFRG